MKEFSLVGKITLEEKVNAVKSVLHPKALIIDVPNPLISYYTRFTDIKKPNSIIFITKAANSFETILRATEKINTKYSLDLESAKTVVKLGSKILHGIRLKGINRYTSIDGIMNHFIDEGFDFNTNMRLKDSELALIRVNKFFNISEINETIYKSTDTADAYFFKIDQKMNWDDFKVKTLSIKHNIKSTGYDIAKGILYNNGKINDIVRVVGSNLSLDLVKEIENKYKK